MQTKQVDPSFHASPLDVNTTEILELDKNIKIYITIHIEIYRIRYWYDYPYVGMVLCPSSRTNPRTGVQEGELILHRTLKKGITATTFSILT